MPLKGESGDLQNGCTQLQTQMLAKTAQWTPAIAIEHHAEMETANHTPGEDHLRSTFETPPPPCRSTCQRFKSDYMRQLHTGEGMHDGHITLDYMRQLHDSDSYHSSPMLAEMQ